MTLKLPFFKPKERWTVNPENTTVQAKKSIAIYYIHLYVSINIICGLSLTDVQMT